MRPIAKIQRFGSLLSPSFFRKQGGAFGPPLFCAGGQARARLSAGPSAGRRGSSPGQLPTRPDPTRRPGKRKGRPGPPTRRRPSLKGPIYLADAATSADVRRGSGRAISLVHSRLLNSENEPQPSYPSWIYPPSKSRSGHCSKSAAMIGRGVSHAVSNL